MLHRVRAAYIIGTVLWVGGVGLAVIGATTGPGTTYVCHNGTAFCTYHINLGLLITGLYVAWWVSLGVLVAAYGRSKSRPFFPLFVAGLVIPFPFTLLAIAVTSTVDGAPQHASGPAPAAGTAGHPLGPYFE